jgi:hypothetical protein
MGRFLRTVRLFGGLLLAAAGGLAHCQSEADARRIVERYSKAMLAKNIAAMVETWNPILISKIGSTGKAKAEVDDLVKSLEGNQAWPISEKIGRIREYSDDSIHLYFVETVRYRDAFPNPVGINHVYLVDTKDEGKTWHVLDLVCVNLAWVHGIAPAFRDDAMVSDILPE